MPNEVTWRVSPHVFSDLHAIIAKHGMGLPGPFGINPSGPDAAALEIIEKYGLRKGIPLRLVVDYKLATYLEPMYKEPEFDPVTGDELEEGCYMMGGWVDGLCAPNTGCPGCAQERRRRASYDLYKALQSAASTAHYRGTLRGASDSCHGTFEECTNCQRWKDVLKKATGEL